MDDICPHCHCAFDDDGTRHCICDTAQEQKTNDEIMEQHFEEFEGWMSDIVRDELGPPGPMINCRCVILPLPETWTEKIQRINERIRNG